MISIFNSTADYKEFLATNFEKIRKNDGKGIQELRRLHSVLLDRGCISRIHSGYFSSLLSIFEPLIMPYFLQNSSRESSRISGDTLILSKIQL